MLNYISSLFLNNTNNLHSYEEETYFSNKPAVTKSYSLDDMNMYQKILDDINTNKQLLMFEDENDKINNNIDNIKCKTCNTSNLKYTIKCVTNTCGDRYTDYNVICRDCNEKITEIFRFIPQ